METAALSTEAALSTTNMSSSATTTPSLDYGAFPSFPKLAAELRLKIWKYSLPGPRVLKMVTYQDGTTRSHVNVPHLHLKVTLFRATNCLDGLQLLHVCRESRDVVAEVLDSLPSPPGLRLLQPQYPLYFDPAVDILHFDSLGDLLTFGRVYKGVKIAVRRIAVAVTVTDRSPSPLRVMELVWVGNGFDELKEYILVEDLRRRRLCVAPA